MGNARPAVLSSRFRTKRPERAAGRRGAGTAGAKVPAGTEAAARHSRAARNRLARSEEPQCARRTSACCCSFRATTPMRSRICAPLCSCSPISGGSRRCWESRRSGPADPEEAQNDLERAFSESRRAKDPDSGWPGTDRALFRVGATRQGSGRGRNAAGTGAARSADPARHVPDFAADDGPEPAEHDGGCAGFRGDAHDHGAANSAARAITPNAIAQYREAIRLNPNAPRSPLRTGRAAQDFVRMPR